MLESFFGPWSIVFDMLVFLVPGYYITTVAANK